MAKLTKQQKVMLGNALRDLRGTRAFLAEPDIVVARKCREDGPTRYVIGNPSAMSPEAGRETYGAYPHLAITAITKDIGSPLAYLSHVERTLEALLEQAL